MLGGGEFLKAGVVIWATGVAVPKVVGTWGLPQGRGGRISVEDDLRVNGFKNIFAVGDVALLPGCRCRSWRSRRCRAASTPASRSPRWSPAGRRTPFHYHDKGTMATVGRRAAIADIALIKGKSIKLTGTLAWLAWLFVHIVMLLGNRNRLATLVNLSTKYLAPSRRTNPIVGDVPVFEHQIPEARATDRSGANLGDADRPVRCAALSKLRCHDARPRWLTRRRRGRGARCRASARRWRLR